MKKIENIVQYIFVLIIFSLLIFGLYKAINSKEYLLAVGTLTVLFVFTYLMSEIGKIKKFKIGGDKLNVSVNEDSNEPSE